MRPHILAAQMYVSVTYLSSPENPITAIMRSMGMMVMHACTARISGRPHKKASPQT